MNMAIQTIKYIFWLLPILGLTQALLQNPGDDFPFSTVIDILSENVEFSTFLRIIQKTGHVQYLNELQNFTLFAPINSAFIKGTKPQTNLRSISILKISLFMIGYCK